MIITANNDNVTETDPSSANLVSFISTERFVSFIVLGDNKYHKNMNQRLRLRYVYNFSIISDLYLYVIFKS